MNKNLVERFKNGGEIAVNCKTEHEAKTLIEWCYNNGMRWSGESSVSTFWERYGKRTCYICSPVDNLIFYDDDKTLKCSGKKIVPFSKMFDGKFTKDDLKTGMRVELRNGQQFLVLLDYETTSYGKGAFVRDNGFMSIRTYDDNLIMRNDRDKQYDVMKVFKPSSDSSVLYFEHAVLVWERTEPKELTLSEVSKLLGYDVKIVGD